MEEAQVDGPKDYQRRIREEVLDMEITKSFIKTIDTKWLKKTGRSSTVGGRGSGGGGGGGGRGSRGNKTRANTERQSRGQQIMEVWIGKIMNTRGKQVLMVDQSLA
jgi:hypothetical protein